jgi:hypothetical protein
VTRSGEGLRRVEREIVGEKAAALGRAGERLDAALAQLSAVTQALAGCEDETRLAELRGEYRTARERARTARLHLLIQREAVGLRSHRVVDQQFPEPPPLPWL